MKRNVLKFIQGLLIVFFLTFLIKDFSISFVFKGLLISLSILLVFQFLYGFIFYKFEKINKKYFLAILFLIFGVCLFCLNKNIINVLALLFTMFISWKYSNEKRSFHNGLFNVIISFVIYIFIFYLYGDSSFIIGMCLPISFFYLVQEIVFNKDKKSSKLVLLIFILLTIVLGTYMFINYDVISISNYFIYVLILTLIVFFRGLFYAYTIKFTKIELFVYLYILLINILSLSSGYLLWIIPLLILCYSLSVDEKYELVSVKKFIKNKDIKKVSAVIPNYNYARYMNKRIDSIINQTYPVYELIILDDMSTDDSDKVIKERVKDLKKMYPKLKVKYIPNKVNSGNVFKQWTKAFEESTGDYLWICEADDLCSKYLLNAAMHGFKDDKVVLSYVESLAIDENDHIFMQDMRLWNDVTFSGRWNGSYIIDGEEELKKYLCINNSINNASSVVFKKDKNIPVEEYLKNAQSYRLAGDWYFYAKYLLHGKIAYCADSLNYHRLHSNSVTNTTNNKKTFEEVKRVQKSIAEDVVITKEVKKQIQDYNSTFK